jgi:hypothetical protein
MNAESLGYMKDRIVKLEEHYGKKNIGEIILNIAKKLEAKRPNVSKEITLERAYALTVGMLEKSKGFDAFEWAIPVAIKGPSDWNRETISEVLTTWKNGNGDVRAKLVAERRVMLHEGKPVSKILKYETDPDGRYRITAAEYVDPMDENSLPIPRDVKKEFKPGSANFNYDRPLYPRYHLDLYCLTSTDEGGAKVILLRYQKDLADPDSDKFVGSLLFTRLFKKYELRAQIVKDDKNLPVFDGNTSSWDKEVVDKDIDLKLSEALSHVDEMIKNIPLADIEDSYKTFFTLDNGKKSFDRLGISEVTIKKTDVDKFGRTVLYLGDPSMDIADMDVRGYVSEDYALAFPTLPCTAIITFYIRERDGKYDAKLHQRVDGKTYELGITGINFISGGGLEESEKKELEELLGE